MHTTMRSTIIRAFGLHAYCILEVLCIEATTKNRVTEHIGDTQLTPLSNTPQRPYVMPRSPDVPFLKTSATFASKLQCDIVVS